MAHLVTPDVSGREEPGSAGRRGLQGPQQVVWDDGDVKVVAADRTCSHSVREINVQHNNLGKRCPAGVEICLLA